MSLLNQTTLLFSHLNSTTNTTSSKTLSKTLSPFFFFPKPTKINSYNNVNQQQHEEEEHVIGDCLVFEQGIFDDPFIQTPIQPPQSPKPNSPKIQVKPQDLIPDNWKDIQAEINITKKERRKMAQQMEFGTKLQKRKEGLKPIPMGYATAKEYKAAKLRELKPLVLDNPQLLEGNDDGEGEEVEGEGSRGVRVAPRNPKMAVYGRSLDDISRFLNSGRYDPDAAKDPQGARKLFSKEEKILMNRRIPDLAVATSGKWQPLHTLAASGEFYLVDTLMKYNVDINVPNQEGLTAIHKAILGKKHAICNYLLRNSANPFVRDRDGATLMHYAVRTTSTQMIKVLLLYNVDINLQDNDGWTPLHLAVQARRTDVVRLLLIKKADITLKNHDGLTPQEIDPKRDRMTDSLIRSLVEAIHSTPTQAVLYFSGGATQLLGWLGSVPGASNTVLEVIVPYSRMSMIQLLGKVPIQFTSKETAEDMALVAYNRALKLSKPGSPVVGVGFTGSLATSRPKLGDHRFYLSTRTSDRLWASTITLSKGLRSREQEDRVSSQVLLKAIADACKVSSSTAYVSDLTENEVPEVSEQCFDEDHEIEQLISGKICFKVFPFSSGIQTASGERKVILSGSFNPLHDGHLKLLEVAMSLCTNGYPCFELSAINADKPPLTVAQVKDRVKQFEKAGKTVIISNQPYFYKKAELFPGSAFVIGADTAARLINPKYYGGSYDNMIETLLGCKNTGCTFLVGGRNMDGVFKVLEDFDIPDKLKDMFVSIPVDKFRMDISSTELRKKQGV